LLIFNGAIYFVGLCDINGLEDAKGSKKSFVLFNKTNPAESVGQRLPVLKQQ